MLKEISFGVDGVPAPKGSYRPITQRSRVTGKPVTRLIPMSKKEHPWRQAVVNAVRQRAWNIKTIDSPICAYIVFSLPRPKTVTRRSPTVKPDLDKLLRSTFDGLTDSGLIRDDSLIVKVSAEKKYATDHCGAYIKLEWEES